MQTTTSRRTLRRALLAPAALLPPLAVLAALVIPALGGASSHAASSAAATVPGITLRASVGHLPARIPTGMLALRLLNDTQMPASVDLARANPGTTDAAVMAANAAGNSPQGYIKLLSLLTFLGGPDSAPPGTKETAILDLRTPGRYFLDFALGQTQDHLTTFTVTPGSGQGAALPSMALPVTLKDMRFVGLPQTLAAGPVTFKLTNSGPQVHEITLAKLDAGKTEQNVKNLFKGPRQGHGSPPPWAHVVGGLNMISAHQTAYLMVTLTPGTYAALCTMPDVRPGPMQGAPHAAEGMVTTFTVK